MLTFQHSFVLEAYLMHLVLLSLEKCLFFTTPEFNTLIAENFEERLKQANLVSQTDFDNKLTSFNKRITSNKTKYLEFQKNLNSLIKKDYDFFLGRIYFTSNDGSHNTFVYQPTLDILELKKVKALREWLILNLSHYILLSYIA